MNSLRVLGAASALALVFAMPTASFAQFHGRGGGGGGHVSVGGGAFHGGGAAFRGGGGNFAAGAAVRPGGAAPSFSGSRSFAAAPVARPSAAAPSFSGGRNFAAASPGWNGGWRGGGWHRRGGFWPGVAAGATIGALGSYAYYGGPYYGDPYYYGDDSYYDDSAAVAVVPDTGGDSAAYCAQRFRSYDPASGTYLGYDGLRHPCP